MQEGTIEKRSKHKGNEKRNRIKKVIKPFKGKHQEKLKENY